MQIESRLSEYTNPPARLEGYRPLYCHVNMISDCAPRGSYAETRLWTTPRSPLQFLVQHLDLRPPAEDPDTYFSNCQSNFWQAFWDPFDSVDILVGYLLVKEEGHQEKFIVYRDAEEIPPRRNEWRTCPRVKNKEGAHIKQRASAASCRPGNHRNAAQDYKYQRYKQAQSPKKMHRRKMDSV